MLAQKYLFSVRNDSGEDISADNAKVWAQGWKFASGDVSYGTEVEVFSNELLATTVEQDGSEVDNSSNLFLGLNCTFQVTGSGTPNGTVTVFYKPYTATGKEATVGNGRPVASIFIDNTSIHRRSFEIVGDA